jgi:two-component system, sensor histidine kinase and response regulator
MAKKILCIEDNFDMRLTVRMALENVGYEMDEAEDGKTGIELALKSPPDLILCDINMPGMDGFATLEEIRKHKSTSHIPFIFLTGEDPRSNLRKGMNLGADDFILKPFDIYDFIKAVEVRLEEAERAKKESQQAIDQLSENITRALPHELRTPMTGILGLAELLKSQVGEMTPEEIKDSAQSIFDSAIRMNQTLEKFWIYTQSLLLLKNEAKLTASREMGTEAAEQIIKFTAEDIANRYARNDDLKLELQDLALGIAERYLQHIFIQIIDNAFKFSPKGSKIVISSAVENGSGIITVKDNGRGISEEQLQNINTFMQFERERYEQQGLGLGLMIAKRLTIVHSGTLNVSSFPKDGTTVTITIPLLP